MAAVEEMNLMDLAHRIREMREITGLSVSEMAEKTDDELKKIDDKDQLTDIVLSRSTKK